LVDTAEKKDWTEEIFGLRPLTKKETDFHGLPPDPEDEVRSTTKSSQGPISLGRETVTTGGDFTTEGAESVVFWESFDFQLEQEGSTREVHRAFNTPLLTSNRSPGPISAPMEEISSDESLVHTQRAEGERAWEVSEEVLKSDPQEITFATLPRLVGELNVTLILLPSGENSDRWTEGGDDETSTPFTTSTSPAGNTTL
jgi:hypothetical protein